MRYRLNNNSSNTVVEVLNLDSSNEFKLIEQLKPFIIITDENPNYFITIQSSDENSYLCQGNCLHVSYATNNFLFKTLRQSIRDIIYFDCLKDGYVKLHASSVSDGDSSTLIIGCRNAGKTSLAMGLAKYQDYSIIDGDLTLVKGTDILGWQTAVGIRNCAAKVLGFEPKSDKEFMWFWPSQLMNLGYKFEMTGKIDNIVIPKFNFTSDIPSYREICEDEKKRLLIENIHYIEMNKVNYWNNEEVDVISLIENFFNNNDIINKRMIEFQAAGINEGNARVLHEILKR